MTMNGTDRRTLIRTGAVVTMDAAGNILPQGGILVRGPVIERVLNMQEAQAPPPPGTDILDARGLVAIPGFVQTHLHLCQTLFRGLAEDMELLDWLQLRIFPYEAAHSAASMRASAMLGIAELVRGGTTTVMDMGSIHHEEEIVRAIQETGLRACVGKSMIDRNEAEPRLSETTHDVLTSTLEQARLWHNTAGGRIRYAVAPRFVLSCSDELLREAHAMTAAFPGMLLHTHAAENPKELEAVRRRCAMGNIEFFESLGILQSNTCLAHCVWLSPREVDLLAARQARVLHCPSSNLKLASGIARIPELLSRGIPVSLGADGAPCNNTLNMFTEMRLASLLQKPAHGPAAMPASLVLGLATRGGAEALGWGDRIGSLEAGKNADIVLLDLDRPWMPAVEPEGEVLYTMIVHSGTPENVRSVMIDGAWVYRNGEHTRLDEQAVTAAAKSELRALLRRTHRKG
jgi:5-methylthioadenosine/S-adenosylhomocysteine deaminase